MTSKKIGTMAWRAGVALIVLVIVGGVLLFQKKSSTPAKGPAVQSSSQLSASLPEPSGPIVRDHKGVTEISLPNAPAVVTKPTVEQLKKFRKRSEELAKKAAKIKEEKGAGALTVAVRETTATVEPVYTYEQQRIGLIGRESLQPDDGMLYVFQMDDPGRLFGTKGMKFPLDFIWMNQDLTVVHIHKNVPPDFEGDLKSDWPASSVLEVNAGYADRHGISVGNTFDFSKIPH